MWVAKQKTIYNLSIPINFDTCLYTKIKYASYRITINHEMAFVSPILCNKKHENVCVIKDMQ